MELLLTWVWQGSLVALVATGVLWAVPTLSAATRYYVWWVALGVVLLLPLTYALADAAAVPTTGPRGPLGSGVVPLPSVPLSVFAGIFMAWGGATLFGLVRFVHDIRRLRQSKARVMPMPADLERRLPRWRAARDHGRGASLGLTDEGRVASVLGLGAPVIVVPRVLVDTLTDAELDQVVLHEYAHVERRDDWANLLQVLVAVPCGAHPAVWLVNRGIRRERELAADDWAATRCAGPRAYARCLARVAATAHWRGAPRLASGVSGSRGVVARRVARLLDPRQNHALRPSRPALAATAGAAGVLIIQLGWLPPIVEFGASGETLTLVAQLPERVSSPPASARAARVPARVSGARMTARRATESRAVAARPEPPIAASRLPVRAELLTPRARAVAPLLVASRGRARPLFARGLPQAGFNPLAGSVPGTRRGLLAAGIPAQSLLTRSSPWRSLGRAGASVGVWFAGAGQATASAFTGVGASFKRAFAGGD